MDTCAFSEGLARLYAEFAESIKHNDSESVRNTYKQLRNSGRPISEILNEAIRTIGVSYEELEKHLLGEDGSKPAQGLERSVLLEPASAEPDIRADSPLVNFDNRPVHDPDTTLFVPPSTEFRAEQLTAGATRKNGVFRTVLDAIFGDFYVRLATWAVVVGIIGLVLVSILQMVPVSSSSNGKLAARNEVVSPRPAKPGVVPAAQKDVAPPVSSPTALNSITAVPPGNPLVPAIPPQDASPPQPAIPVKAQAIDEDAIKPASSPKPTATAAVRPPGLTASSDAGRPSAGVQNEVKPLEPPPSAAAEVPSNAGPRRASNETGMGLNAPAIPPRGGPAADTSLLLERGDSLFRIGDIASARGFYERAAEQGNGQAALRLGESYDRSFLQQARLPLVRADSSTAVLWYRRARDLGVTEAQILLKDAKE